MLRSIIPFPCEEREADPLCEIISGSVPSPALDVPVAERRYRIAVLEVKSLLSAHLTRFW